MIVTAKRIAHGRPLARNSNFGHWRPWRLSFSAVKKKYVFSVIKGRVGPTLLLASLLSRSKISFSLMSTGIRVALTTKKSQYVGDLRQ
jgi:hypothetical protein